MGTPAPLPNASSTEPARAPTPPPRRTSPGRLLADRTARWIVTGGGLAIVASILGILLFILHEVAPLASGAAVSAGPVRPLGGGAPLAILTDEYRELSVG